MTYLQPPYSFAPCCLATTIGSLPHADVARGTRVVFETTPEIPAWVQFPRRAWRENMMVQFTEGMPGLVESAARERVYFDTGAAEFVDQLTDFYTRYLAAMEEQDQAALDSFGLTAEYAAGFDEFFAQFARHEDAVRFVKGQVTGPFTLGTNLLDQNRRCAYYDAQLRDVIVKTVTMKAVWQVKRLQTLGYPVMVFLDEPALLGFGSQTFITVSREDIVHDLNEVVDTIHGLGALVGVHCEENTDWSLLMETALDILDFDAYDHVQGITLYPAELRAFFKRGGVLGWGIVPTLDREAAATETVSSLLARFDAGLARLAKKGFDRELLLQRALLTPSCGAGGVLTPPLDERVMGLLHEVAAHLLNQYFASTV